jgi:hypothetical protein
MVSKPIPTPFVGRAGRGGERVIATYLVLCRYGPFRHEGRRHEGVIACLSANNTGPIKEKLRNSLRTTTSVFLFRVFIFVSCVETK